MFGSSVLIEGSVTDIAAGTTATASRLVSKRRPAVSDDSMTAWMEYVYMQMPKPTNTLGVDVVVNVIDPNGNFYEVAKQLVIRWILQDDLQT